MKIGSGKFIIGNNLSDECFARTRTDLVNQNKEKEKVDDVKDSEGIQRSTKENSVKMSDNSDEHEDQ